MKDRSYINLKFSSLYVILKIDKTISVIIVDLVKSGLLILIYNRGIYPYAISKKLNSLLLLS